MDNKLKKLLNSLVKAGWKPFNRYYEGMKVEIRTHENYQGLWYDMDVLCEDQYGDKDKLTFKPRQVVSKESGLWQFVCENGMVRNKNSEDEDVEEFLSWTKEYYCEPEPGFSKRMGTCDDSVYEYRLIETSLKNEDELEQFLLDNIIINEQA